MPPRPSSRASSRTYTFIPPASRVRPSGARGEVCRLSMATLKHMDAPRPLGLGRGAACSLADARPPPFGGAGRLGRDGFGRGAVTDQHDETSASEISIPFAIAPT